MISSYDYDENCVFCKKVAAEDYDQLDVDFDVVNFEPLNPVTEGHRLFVPVAHVADAAADYGRTSDTFGAAAKWVKRNVSPLQAFNLITSAGKYATQTVEHLHCHLIPRHKGDGLPLPWTGQIKEEA